MEELAINFLKKVSQARFGKKCIKCGKKKPYEMFGQNKKSIDGRRSECKKCKASYQALRREQFKNKHGCTEIQLSYKNEREKFLLRSYKNYDKKKGFFTHNADYHDILSLTKFLINSVCHYCGSADNLGLDRINNSLGHQKHNVIPCCSECNRVRGDRFTSKEMEVIGFAMMCVIGRRNGEKMTPKKLRAKIHVVKNKRVKPYKQEQRSLF